MHLYDSIMYACIVMWVMWVSIVGRPILDLITSNYILITMVSMVWSWHPFLSLIPFGLPKASLNTRSPATSASPRRCHIQPPKPSEAPKPTSRTCRSSLAIFWSCQTFRETWSARKSKFQRRGNIWHQCTSESCGPLSNERAVLLYFEGQDSLTCSFGSDSSMQESMECLWSSVKACSQYRICKMTPSFEINKITFQSFAGSNDEWDGRVIKSNTYSLDPLSIYFQHISTMFEP